MAARSGLCEALPSKEGSFCAARLYKPREAAIERLTSKQRAHLRSLAHDLDPAVHIGKDGVNASTLKATEEAFNTRELLKVRVLENAPEEARATGQELAEQLEDVQIVQVIGRVVVLYRPDPDGPEIRLPR